MKRPKGTGGLTTSGYICHKHDGKYHFEHRMIAATALGRPLRGSELVHHFNEDRTDNRPSNLVICPDSAYHKLLHKRQDAMAACGNPDWRKCVFCKQYDSIDNLQPHSNRGELRHRLCANEYNRKIKARLRLIDKGYGR